MKRNHLYRLMLISILFAFLLPIAAFGEGNVEDVANLAGEPDTQLPLEVGVTFPEDGPPPGLVPPAPENSDATFPNLTTGLSEIYREMENGNSVDELVTNSGTIQESSGDRIRVTLIMNDEAAAQHAIATLPTLGAEVIVSFETWIDAWVPVSSLLDIAALPGVSLLREPVWVFPVDADSSTPPRQHLPFAEELRGVTVGAKQTQGVIQSGANVWHAAGWRGQGVKVAVIDDFKDYQIAQQLGELPGNIVGYPSLNHLGASSPHGTACAEIIYDMAPGVQFTFASPRTVTEMAQYILALASQGNRIISSSFGWVGYEPGDGSGLMNNAISQAYLTYGTLFVQAAGNMREFHWDGYFNDSNVNHWHEFQPNVDINWFTTEANVGHRMTFYLRWNSWWQTSDDFDLYLVRYEPSTNSVVTVASSTLRQTGTQPPWEGIELQIDKKGYYGIAIQRYSARGDAVLDLGGYGLLDFSINQPARSLIDAARSPYAFSVAAVDVNSYQQEVYSSEGPTHGTGGGLTGNYISKPNISGFANVDTWAYGDKGFYGTSSATPHVAGAAAVVLSAYPGSHAYHLWTHLQGFALDRGPAGFDFQYGNGVLRMATPPTSSGGTPPGQCSSCAPDVERNLYLPFINR